MFRIIRALVLVVALVAILVASSPTPVLTNARAIQEGKPLLRPRAVPQCFPGANGCAAARDMRAQRAARLAADPFILHRLRGESLASLFGKRDVSGFSNTCAEVDLEHSTGTGPVLVAMCQTDAGESTQTSLGLSSILMAHDDGKLLCVPEDKIYQHMSIAKKCADCAMSGSVISCLCLGSTGFVVDTYVDLNTCVGNSNGQLK
ncbi:uncharacterized protein EHS24_008478 [Apiotrichum porosum]|uniref:Cyanovirin-N domain-containing protein n=1 Tax=Apiotrichum porosum TaxID=105984 RepID=A0A427XQB4_9TREE|nr:uncharacterized protein EHS24_008478 [Apiotrichum porosum]RSH81044.1 hypothetical protein EHS24_008478 [Apiotrichum porosum]